MSINEENKIKRKLVALTWNNERTQILEGLGSYDWSMGDQESILTNKLVGYVGQWTVDYEQINNQDVSKVQLLHFLSDYLLAHSDKNKLHKFGYYETSLCVVRPNISVRNVLLADPVFAGKKAVNSIGENEFGITVGASKLGTSNSRIRNKEIRKREYGF